LKQEPDEMKLKTQNTKTDRREHILRDCFRKLFLTGWVTLRFAWFESEIRFLLLLENVILGMERHWDQMFSEMKKEMKK
jgi:hypothetical protein